MSRLILLVCCTALTASVVLAQEQVTRDLPLRFANAVELVAMFSDKPPSPPPSTNMGAFASRCLTAAFADFPNTAGMWQAFAETQSDLRPAPGPVAGGLSRMLPQGMAEPPALGAGNSLRLRGTADALQKFGEIVQLLDKPAKRLSLRVEILQARDLDGLGGVEWNWRTNSENQPNATVVRFARVRLLEMLQQPHGVTTPIPVGVTVATRNNSVAEVRLAEVLASYKFVPGDARPESSAYGRFLRFRLVPRLNADDSVTISVDSDFAAGATQPAGGTAPTPPELRPLVATQFRAAAGETVLAAGFSINGGPDGGVLASPVLAITPCVLPD